MAVWGEERVSQITHICNCYNLIMLSPELCINLVYNVYCESSETKDTNTEVIR